MNFCFWELVVVWQMHSNLIKGLWLLTTQFGYCTKIGMLLSLLVLQKGENCENVGKNSLPHIFTNNYNMVCVCVCLSVRLLLIFYLFLFLWRHFTFITVECFGGWGKGEPGEARGGGGQHGWRGPAGAGGGHGRGRTGQGRAGEDINK
jgi:hypothetical protein